MTGRWRDFNIFLPISVVVLLGLGSLMLYSATAQGTFAGLGMVQRHLLNIAVGMVLALLIAVTDYRALLALARPAYLLVLLLLGAVLLSGIVRSGAQSWIALGTRTIQPSEPAKVLLIIALAAFFARFEDTTRPWRLFIGSLLLTAIPLGMIFLQPDLGTAVVVGLIWLGMAFVAGVRWYQLLLLLVLAIPAAYLGWTRVLDPEQRERLLIFIDPLGYDPTLQHGAWNIIQSLNAIGNGGLLGAGWQQGPIAQSGLLPVQYSDFIFAVVSEELGFVGASLLLLFQGIVLWQAISIAATARDLFGRLLAVGVTSMLLAHLLINAGMNMSIMPVTGLPMPFISYGGSFTVTTLLAMGLLQSVALYRRRLVLS
jgi:rod shape determining protein RodA